MNIDIFNDSPPPKINLATPEDIRREMAKVYREARGHKLAASDATKYIFILTQILRAAETSKTTDNAVVELEAT